MYPEDRVMVAVMTSLRDLAIARDQGWYRIPHARAPKNIHAEYLAFYFNRAFGDRKWAIHYYAKQLGHELVRRGDLLPTEKGHPRTDKLYYKIQLGPLQQLKRPIVSLRWRRISFLHTTWDRFQDAVEINDLFVEGKPYVDRLYYALREEGIHPERDYHIADGETIYRLDMLIPCLFGTVEIVIGDRPAPPSAIRLEPALVHDDPNQCATLIQERIVDYGGSKYPDEKDQQEPARDEDWKQEKGPTGENGSRFSSNLPKL